MPLVVRIEAREYARGYNVTMFGRGSTGLRGREDQYWVAPEDMPEALDAMRQTLEDRLEPVDPLIP